MASRLPSIRYEPPGEPSLFDRWEQGVDVAMLAPLAVRDATYRALVVELLAPYSRAGARLISVGAGNGHAEAALAQTGWEVLATDPAASALRHCRAKGLCTARFELLSGDASPDAFDAVYCDGVMGHLWDSAGASARAWNALAELGCSGAVCLVSNDLADDDEAVRFKVRSSPDIAFYRPPAGGYAAEALATGRWSLERERIYPYERNGVVRRRELIVVRLTGARTDRSGRSPADRQV